MASTLVQPPTPIRFSLSHPPAAKLWTAPLVPPRTTPAAAATSLAALHTPSKQHAGVVLFADDKPAATSSASPASADIDRLLSTAPTAIPRPIAFVQPQKDINARPQHSTPASAPATPTSTTAPLPATQRSTSSPVTPALPTAPAAAAVRQGQTNGIHAPLASRIVSSSPKLTASPKLKPASTPAPVDENTFHPALHQLFPPSQLPALSQWPATITGPGAGLSNEGNSCFLNATLQALTHTPLLLNYCLSRRHSQHCQIKHQKPLPPPPPPPAPPRPSFGFGMWRSSLQPSHSSLHHQHQQPLPPFCLFCALEDNIVRSFKPSAPAFAPHVIFNRLPTIGRSLRRGRQEDAHEFLRLALDMLQNNVLAADLPASASSSASAASKAPPSLPKGSSVPAALFATLTPAQLHRIKETSVLYQIFSGYYRSTLTCRSCHQPSHTFETFLDLSLSIPTSSAPPTSASNNSNRFPHFGFNRPYQPAFSQQPAQPPLTLHQCLRAFTSEEQLDNDNMYKCTACNKKTRASKRLTIHTAPNVLVVHLKRFEHSGGGLGGMGGGGKIGRMVRFETVLDVGDYMSERGVGKVEYELYGVLVHAGSTLYSGHYFSFVKAADGRWYEMNDSSVQRRSVEEVLAQKAYILFYTKRTIDTAAKGAATAAGSSVAGVGQAVTAREKGVGAKKEKAVAPLSATNGAMADKSADDLIKALMRGQPCEAAVTTPHLNGHGPKAVEERKEQPGEKAAVEERKEERKKAIEEEKKVEPAVLSATKPVERPEESKVGADVEEDEHREEKEERKADGNRISLVQSTIHQTTVRISLLTPNTSSPASTTSTTTSATHPSSPLLIRPPTSPLSPPAALLASPTSSTSSTSSLKRKQPTAGSPPAAGPYPGMPSFRAGSQAKLTAFAGVGVVGGMGGSGVKKARREVIGNGVGAGIRLVPYSSSSSEDDEQLEESKAVHSGASHKVMEVQQDIEVEQKKQPVPPPQLTEQKTAAGSTSPPPASQPSHPSQSDEQKAEPPRYAENNDRKRRRLDIEATIQPSRSTATPSTPAAVRFDPHASRHTAHSHYGTHVGTWDDDDTAAAAGSERERRERDELLRRLERERRGRLKDEYDVRYDEGRKRKVRGEKDEWRGVAVKEGENLLQREQERRADGGDRRDDRDRHDDRRHSGNRGRHRDGDPQQGSHHRPRDDSERSREQHHDHDRRHSSSSHSSSHRDNRDSHHSHHNRRDGGDRSRHSWSHRR